MKKQIQWESYDDMMKRVEAEKAKKKSAKKTVTKKSVKRGK